jgi:hypothetical protein
MLAEGGDMGLNVWVENGSAVFFHSPERRWDEKIPCEAGTDALELQSTLLSPAGNTGSAAFERRHNFRKVRCRSKGRIDCYLVMYISCDFCSMQSKTPRRMLVSYERLACGRPGAREGESRKKIKWRACWL